MILTTQCPDQATLSRLRNETTGSPGAVIKWPDVVVNASYKKLEKEIPESAFTIFTLKTDGRASIFMKGKNLKICKETFCVVNPYESLQYRLDSDKVGEIFNIHLSLATFEEMLGSILSDDDQLLNNPNGGERSYQFTNYIYYKERVIRENLQRFHINRKEDYPMAIFEILFLLIKRHQSAIQSISSLKPATRQELFNRVATARDMIFSQFSDPNLTLDLLCREASMSKFHFLRIFKQVYGYTPHKLIQQVRLKKALEYLKQGKMTVSDIAFNVGFQETNSIYPLLKTSRYRLN